MNKNKKLRIATPILDQYRTGAAKAQAQSQANKPQVDVLRSLRNELERIKTENSDLREENSVLTQKYLYAKNQINELLQKMDAMKKQWGGQEKFIHEKVIQGIQINQEQLQKTVQKQQTLIEKLRRDKVLLGKNAYDLQERLKDTRHELHLTQKQLYALQKADVEAKEISPSTHQIHGNSKQGTRHNQIMNFDGVEHFGGKIDRGQAGESLENEQLDDFSLEVKGPKVKQNRLGLGVARSLALAKIPFNGASEHEKKYNWLFNDDETPREEDPASSNPTRGSKTRKHKYLENEEQTTATNSNFVSRPQALNQANDCENLTDTMQSMHDNPDEVLLGRRGRYGAKDSPQVRESLVGKSIQGMKNIIRKAKESDLQAIIPKVSVAGSNRPNSRIIDHNQLDFDFRNADNAKFEENPLDDESN